MKGLCKATVKKRLLAAVLAVLLGMAFQLPEGAGTSRVQAAENTEEIANVVVFVKFQDDTKDIFNNTNGSLSNWQEIKKMYDSAQDSFSNYISAVTEGNVHVTNYFPQEQSDGQSVQTLVIPRSDGSGVVNAVVKALSEEQISINTTDKLDNRQAGILDNLTIIVQGNVADPDKGESAFKSVYAGMDKVKGLLIRDYNMIPSAKLVLENPAVNVLPQQGVIAHEFLHTLGLPDLYRSSGSGDPVGIWDIMASVSCFLQYPLSYLRARQGWISMKTITQSGTYTLTAVSESDGDKVFVLKTPVSDSELICLEYRKKAADPNQFDYRIPASGLLMYRVDPKVDGLTNNAGKNYIYVYRPGVTHSEAATDGAINQAALKVTDGASYGTTDLDAGFTQNTLYYSDGSNSGIRISDLKLSADQSKLTFTVTFADYSQSGVWDKLDEGISGQFSEDPDICIDSATGVIYAAYAESLSGNLNDTQVRVMRWNGTGWQQVGGTIGNARQPVLAVCGGEVYLSYRKRDWKSVVYCKLSGNDWGQVATCAAQYPGSMQFVVDGNEIYGAFQEDSGSGKRLVIYDIIGSKTVTNSLVTSMDFSNPAVAKSGDSFYVACAEFPGGSTQIREYNISTGRWSAAYTITTAFTNMHIMVKQEQKIYAFAGCSAIPGSSEGGTACMAMFDGNSWSSGSVTSMKQFSAVSMDVLAEQVYLAYYDTADKTARLLRGTGTVLEQYSDRLGTGLDFLQIRGYGDSVYAAVRAENTDTMVVRRKVVTESSVTPPDSQNPDPGETEKPNETEKPGETEKPNGTEKPNETEKPGGTDKTDESDKPEETAKPGTPSVPAEGKFATHKGYDFFKDKKGNVTCYNSAGVPVINDFKCDGTYTYYFQADGTAMRDRLTYHPNGKNVIYFDQNGHEVFSDFAYVGHNIIDMKTGEVTELNEYCYFDVNGYQYTNVITWGADGTDRAGKLYYANEGGILERRGWFTFSVNAAYAGDGSVWPGAGQRGYANGADCSLMRETWTYDENNLYRYMNGYGVLE